MTGQQLINLTQATIRARRIGKPAVSVHRFFKTWMKGHRAVLRMAFAAPTEELQTLDLAAIWTACGFTLVDEILYWSADHPTGRGFEGMEADPPWHSDEATIELLTKARDWAPKPGAESEEKLSWLDRRKRERELKRMDRAVLREAAMDELEQAAAWGRSVR